MLTPARINRLAQANDWHGLLREVLANGRPLPKAAAQRLERPSCVKAAAACLGLCRSLELTRRPVRSPASGVGKVSESVRPLLEALRESRGSQDPVARVFCSAALAAIGEPQPEERTGGAGGIGGERGALSAEGSPLDALLTVWALGGIFVSAPNALAERSDPGALFEAAAREVHAMDQRSPLAADLRAMLALASIAVRRSTATRHAA
jgi:hypothetical protein